MTGHLFLLCQEQIAETSDTGKFLAIGSHAAGINVATQAVFKNAAAIKPAIRPVALAGGSITGAESTSWIEAFQSKAGWINVLMSVGAGLYISVLGECFTNGDCTADVGFNDANCGWWRMRRGAE